ncbi:MAG: hypothetical protein KF849_04285 [Rhizobiaceae bacterium]|nr:hypothetical protein [Rhizobiaceae bacterium]
MTRFVETHLFSAEIFALGTDSRTGGHYLSTLVSGRMAAAEYEAYFAISDDDYRRFIDNPKAARDFVERCRMGANAALQP